MATSERFLPWSRETVFKHSPALARLLEYSFQPGSPETALDCPSLTATHASLLECSPCKICQLVYSLASDPDCEVGFFEDYACLCFYCLYAPLTWTSTFMAAADFLELTARYHPGAPGAGGDEQPHFYGPEGIMAVDVQLHFLVKRCFKPVAPSELLGVSNLHFLKSEFLKGALTGSLSGLFCFKSVWGSLHGTSPRQQASFSAASSPATGMGGQCRCNPLAASASAPSSSSSASRGSKNKKQQQQQGANRPPPERQRPVLRESEGEGEGGNGGEGARGPAAGAFAEAFPPGLPRKPEILSVFLDAWAPSDLLSEANRELAASGGAPSRPRFELPYPESADACQGPCLLSHALQLKRRNKTASVCVLCECLAGHGEAAGALARLREDVLTFVENNVQLVDRIAFVKRQPDFLVYVRDPLLRDAVRGCSEQEIHKHLFCDPLCALNAASACPDILFGTPREEKFRILKSSLALGHHLAENVFLDCEVLHTLVIIFKSIQLCKVGKTTFLEIIKELNQQLKSHNLHTLHTFHTATIYC